MNVLGIDTATRGGSVALARPEGIVALRGLDERGRHAGDLLARIDGMLAETGLRPADLSGIAVTVGPGSFTGVRIGMATAKGLAYSLDVPLFGLSTLEALARAALLDRRDLPQRLCAAIEAGRGEVYAALFRLEAGELQRETEDRSWRPSVLVREVQRGTPVVGDAAATLVRAARESGLDLEVIDHPHPPLAGALALRACRTLRPGASYRPGELRPNYVRPSDPEAARR